MKKQLQWQIILILAILFLLHYTVLSMHGDPFNLGTLGSLFLSLYLFILFYLKKSEKRLPLPQSIISIMKWGFILWVISFVIVTTIVVINSFQDNEIDSSYLLVLGAGVKGDRPTPALQRRLDRAVKYLRINKKINVIGCGSKGQWENISESALIKKILTKEGIEPSRIIIEDKSFNTNKNIINAKQIIQQREKDISNISVAIITSDFHLFRAKMIASWYGIKAYGIPAPTPWYLVPNYYFREYFAIAKTLVFDRE